MPKILPPLLEPEASQANIHISNEAVLTRNKECPILFIGSDSKEEKKHVEEMLKNVKPASQFPASPDEIWTFSRQIKPGAMCTVSWTFSKQEQLNVSIGKITRTHSKRGGSGKLSVSYRVVMGYKVGEEFAGALPPHENVRVYKILWHQAPPAIDTTVLRDAFVENQAIERGRADDSGVDLLPMPTLRTISPEFAPCVVAMLRNIVQEYASSDPTLKTKIWHKLLSAIKLSLAAVRASAGRQRRRRPLKDEEGS